MDRQADTHTVADKKKFPFRLAFKCLEENGNKTLTKRLQGAKTLGKKLEER